MKKVRRAAERRRERERGRLAGSDGPTDPKHPADFDPDAVTSLTLPDEDPEAAFAVALKSDASDLTGAVEITAIRERPKGPARVGGRLRVLAGPEAGLEVELCQSPALVGRVEAAQLRLTDLTVSRRHLELRFLPEDEIWILEDLGSTSGTLLNGDPLTVPTEVKHGDVVAIGRSELRFLWSEKRPEVKAPDEKTRTDTRTALDESQTLRRPKALEEKPTRRVPWPLVGAAVGALFLAIAATAVSFYFGVGKGGADDAQIALQVDTLLADAKRLLDEKKLEEARARIDAALALRPDHRNAQSLLRMVQTEKAARAALREAERLLEEGELAAARKALGRIPDASVFAKERDRLFARVGDAERQASLDEIERLVEDGKQEEALAAIKAHLLRWPGDRAATALHSRLLGEGARAPSVHPTVLKARRAFLDGNAAKARVLVEGEASRNVRAAQRYLADLDTFEAALSRGERRLRVMDSASARVDLERAWELLPRLAGKASGPMARRVARALANALYLDAMAKKQRGDGCGHAQDILRAASLAPEDAKVRAQAREVKSRAQQGLERALAVQKSDEARAQQIAREHLCYASPSSSTGKALKRLAE